MLVTFRLIKGGVLILWSYIVSWLKGVSSFCDHTHSVLIKGGVLISGVVLYTSLCSWDHGCLVGVYYTHLYVAVIASWLKEVSSFHGQMQFSTFIQYFSGPNATPCTHCTVYMYNENECVYDWKPSCPFNAEEVVWIDVSTRRCVIIYSVHVLKATVRVEY